MELRVRYFASLTDCTGVPGENVELDEAATLEQLWSLLERRHPRLAQLGYRPLVARDMEYADWGETVEGVSEVAFLPPVSGG